MTSAADEIRSRQAKRLLELRPIVDELEQASRDALKAWKFFTISLETIAHLNDKLAAAFPSAEDAKAVGLDASIVASADTVKLYKTFRKTVNLWSLSDEVVDMRAQLYEEWAVWRRTQRRVGNVQALALERRQEMEKFAELQKSATALRHRSNSISNAASLKKTLERKMKSTEESMKKKDDEISTEFKNLLKKSVLREHNGSLKTGYALRNAGRGMVKAFDGFSNGGELASAVVPEITRTPTVGVPLEINMPTALRTQPATPTAVEAVYGLGFPYNSQASILNDDVTDGEENQPISLTD